MLLGTLRRGPLGLLAAAAVLGGPAPWAAAGDVCDLEASRVVAIGDVHGAYDNFVETLQLAGLVDPHVGTVGKMTPFVPGLLCCRHRALPCTTAPPGI